MFMRGNACMLGFTHVHVYVFMRARQPSVNQMNRHDLFPGPWLLLQLPACS